LKAAAITTFGGPEVLRLVDLPEPTAAPGEVAIDVAYAGVSYSETLFRRGFVPVQLPFVPGIEVAGRIRAVGPGVNGLQRGQPVAALTVVDGGGYAEIAVTDARLVAPIADTLDLKTAAAVPSNTTTASLVFGPVARMRPGETVLVHGAAGGVGSQLGQVAKAAGAELVIGTVGSSDKIEFVRRLGYDAAILRHEFEQRTRELTHGRGVDIVVDPVGGEMRTRSIDVLAPLGRLVVIGNASGADDVQQSLNALWLGGPGALGLNLRDLALREPDIVREALTESLRLVLAGSVRVEVMRELPFEEAEEAHRLLESRNVLGKLVLRIQGS